MSQIYSTEFVIKLFKDKFPKFAINRQTIYYWKKEGVISASQSLTGRLEFSFTDLLQIRTVIELRESGISVRTIKRSILKLQSLFPNHRNPLIELPLVTVGKEIVVIKDGKRLRADTGQEYLFDISQIKMQLTRELRDFKAVSRKLRKRIEANCLQP
ncbi:MAG: MerR family transcriptional regulator [Deltaproteobacteria bacterium]|nr:MAG: MerR family transcriptional regulator [Deltaproteobacteria bacterium]